MKRFEFLPANEQAVVRHLYASEGRPGQEMPLPKVLLAMRQQGVSIRNTLRAVDACVVAKWAVRPQQLGKEPDLVGLTLEASMTLRSRPPGPPATPTSFELIRK